MVLSLLPLLTLGAVAAPQALPRADWAVEMPRLSGVSGVVAFFDRAGESAAMLQPSAWSVDFDPLLHTDPTRPESLRKAELDPEGPAVASARGETHLTCARVLNAARFRARTDGVLASLGAVSTSRSGSVTVVVAKEEGHARAGYALLDRKVCLLSRESVGTVELSDAAAAVRKDSPTVGPAVLWTRRGHFRLSGSRQKLCAEGEATDALGLPPGPPRTLPRKAPGGMLFLQGSLAAPALASEVEANLLALCSACSRSGLHALVQGLLPEVTGEFLTRVDGIRSQAHLADRAGLVRAMRYAGGFVLRNPGSARAALARLAPGAGAHPQGSGWQLPIEGGALSLRVDENLLSFWTDESTRDALRQAPAAGAAVGGFEATLDGEAAARTLNSLSPFELLRHPELAPLVGVQLTLGPLLTQGDGSLVVGKGGAGKLAACWTFRGN